MKNGRTDAQPVESDAPENTRGIKSWLEWCLHEERMGFSAELKFKEKGGVRTCYVSYVRRFDELEDVV